MTPPPSKEQKTSTSPPIIFTTPGTKPDVCLYFFSKEFHVSSASLKLNSTYFRKWIEPSEGILPTSIRSGFASEWFTQVNGDGTWALTSDAKFRDMDTSSFHGNTTRLESAFQNLLCAIFNRPYCILDATELNIMTQMADYYCALPILSNSLSATFFNSPGLLTTLRTDPCQSLILAYKLRHAPLFRDSLIRVPGPWSKPQFQELKSHRDPSSLFLFNFVNTIHISFSNKIIQLQQSIFQLSTGYFPHYNENHRLQAKDMLDCAKESVDNKHNLLLPKWFRRCRDRYLGTLVPELLAPFTTNNLVLDKAAVAGKGDYENSFLCLEISDAELPWDPTQFDW
ncbi:hypothetical protein F5882DRAFT_435512 [Hyaloscypha sp. PMI_1271]|nr:hypothetical protein F5882DRAFT_435512 [Hyaloscypha sp. PMI_1271]